MKMRMWEIVDVCKMPMSMFAKLDCIIPLKKKQRKNCRANPNQKIGLHVLYVQHLGHLDHFGHFGIFYFLILIFLKKNFTSGKMQLKH